jgi:hypothetical protein
MMFRLRYLFVIVLVALCLFTFNNNSVHADRPNSTREVKQVVVKLSDEVCH